jgi:glyceraldehyde-3-phosphate dehydrogenase (NAD(P)+) (phosphorylating)
LIRVGVNGFGTIGRRVADAVARQNDMELVGVTKTRPDYKSQEALRKGINLYAVDEKSLASFRASGVSVKGTLNDLLQRVDVVVDAAPESVGARNIKLYRAAGVRAVFQGGEEHELAGTSFVAQCNFEEAKNKQTVRVVSCNTTGLCRVLGAVDSAIGISKARAVLARRAADPDETGKGPIDAVVLDPVTLPSHHGPDVRTVLHKLDISTMAFKVPTTHMHLHSLLLTLNREASSEQVVRALASAPRVRLIDSKSGFKSTASIIDDARERGSPRNDVYESVVWRDSVAVQGNETYFYMAVHQEAIVVPENIDAIRALTGTYLASESMRLTDEALSIPSKQG